jgi:hypothetical protein
MPANQKTGSPRDNPAIQLHEILAEEFRALHEKEPEHYTAAAKKDDNEKLKAVIQDMHDEPRAALCLSGGGIRSATFALGIVQGLARCDLLDKFHYLSTVSGGGYIGSWLTAWISRAPKGLRDVSQMLSESRTEARPNPEPQQIQNLRNYSNYLSPRLGLLSADTWTLVAIYLRNLVLNWFVFLPLLAAFLMLPWIYTSFVMVDPPPIGNPLLWVSSACVILAVVYMAYSLPSGRNGRRGEGIFLGFCLLPLVLSAIFMTMHWAWIRYYNQTPALSFLGISSANPLVTFICFGIGIQLIGWMLSLLWMHGFVWKEVLGAVVSGAAGGLFLWFAAIKIFPDPLKSAELYVCFAVPLYLSLFFFTLTVFVGICSRETTDEDREWWARAGGWILIAIVAWSVLSALVVFGTSLLSSAYSWTYSIVATGGASGIVTFLAGKSKTTPANEKSENMSWWRSLLLLKIPVLAAFVFVAVMMILVTKGAILIVRQIGDAAHYHWNLTSRSALLGKTSVDLNIILYAPTTIVAFVALGLFLIGLLMASFVNPNRFSLHAMYRDRLIRAYLGASNDTRNPHPFTGFDPNDNIPMHKAWDRGKSGNRFFPVINVALNLVHGRKLAWQERKAASFTISPLHCGSLNANVGYRKTVPPGGGIYCYGGAGGMSLGTAVTISGAAASPNMGYHSSPIVAFVLTLLNVRLGAWAGNPAKRVGDKTFYLDHPRLAIRPMIAEAFGLTDDTNPYVYLSDGGHFENLGLYEMVLRRCHYIVVSDAGQDPKCSFVDLGEAVRKIRIDLGIPIDFSEMFIYARSDDPAQNEKGRYCAIGDIRYGAVDGNEAKGGKLIYIKPACYGCEPRDIYEYYKRSPLFPHESTVNQFFTESQFESYRMLGAYTMQQLCGEEVGNFPDFIKAIERHLTIATPNC